MTESFHRFSTYEFEADQSLLTPHLPDAFQVHSRDTKHSTYRPTAEDTRGFVHSPQTRVHTGALSFTAGDGTAQDVGGVAKHQVSFDGTPGGSVASTFARSGALHTVELIPGQPATRTDVRAAVRAGLIESDGRGGWRDTANRAAAVAAVEAAGRPDKAPEAPQISETFDKEDMSLWAEDIAPLDQQVYDSAVSRAMDAAATGQGLEHVAVQLAKSAGMDPALAAEYVQAGTAMYQRATDKALARVGITGQDLQEFYGHLRQSQPGPLRHALQVLTLGHDTSEFKKLGVSWQEARMRRAAGRGG
ncbi:MAG: hypothetical protein AB9M53_03355 [Leptothrix sp. (in: b-proteobacteria)]